MHFRKRKEYDGKTYREDLASCKGVMLNFAKTPLPKVAPTVLK